MSFCTDAERIYSSNQLQLLQISLLLAEVSERSRTWCAVRQTYRKNAAAVIVHQNGRARS